MKYLVLFLGLFSCTVFAVTPPPYCVYGKVSSSYPEPPECLSSDPIIKNQYISLGLCKSSTGISNSTLSNGYLKIGTLGGIGRYLLINGKNTIKGDGDFLGNGNGHNERISFHDSMGGYRGVQSTNFEGNAYFDYIPYGAYSGSGQIWAVNTAYYNICSKMDVSFQYAPHIQVNGYSIPFNLYSAPSSLTFYYEVDYNSKAVRENLPVTIKVFAVLNGVSYTITNTSNGQRGTVVSYPFSFINLRYGERVTLSAEVNDGTYSTKIYLGAVTNSSPPSNVEPPMYCLMACGGNLDSSARAECQRNNAACEYKVW
ncbi:hypothetical protein [Cellvibrio sp. KY-GH-1]|uniref:hypothetical protein n=1 Tax=Cellvibrio sp. KY-GH-1 TaxID=2303332 RepID=UPI001247360B|nr:hypothetical protein [Cellvibrio sp. KY-GH-1]